MVIEWFMFGALGFFLGCLLGLMLAPPLWNRAVKLTTRRLEATMPMGLADIQADKDQLRADFAIQLRKVEVALERSKEKAARELIEANKRRVEIQSLNTKLEAAKSEVQESDNANRVLQQTIKRRLPDLDARLKAAKKALSDLEAVNAELRNTVASQSEALKIARATVHNQRADIDQLRLSLESGAARGRGSTKTDGRAVAESQRLSAELSRAQEELTRARTSTEEIEFLRRELNNLAAHIMDAARTQGSSQPMMAAMPAAATYEPPVAHPVSQQESWNAENGMTGHDSPASQDDLRAEEMASEEAVFAHEGNGAMEHPSDAPASEEHSSHESTSYETMAAIPTEAPHEAATEPAYEGQETSAETSFVEETFVEESFDPEENYEPEEPFETYELEDNYGSEAGESEPGHDDHGDTGDDGSADNDNGGDVFDDDISDDDVPGDDVPGDDVPGDDVPGDDVVPGEPLSEEAEPRKSSLSQRFAARRAKRQVEKSGGSSLTSRLRGLVADSPERRG